MADFFGNIAEKGQEALHQGQQFVAKAQQAVGDMADRFGGGHGDQQAGDMAQQAQQGVRDAADQAQQYGQQAQQAAQQFSDQAQQGFSQR